MKIRLLLFCFAAVGLRAELEFSGFFVTSSDALFSLTEIESRRTSGWLRIGQSFEGHTIAAFDLQRETITLKREARAVELPLRQPKVKSGKATISGTISFAGQKVQGVRASLFLGEETAFPLENGVTLRLRPEAGPNGAILYHGCFVVTEKDGQEKVLSAPTVSALPGKAFGIQIGNLGYSFAP